MLAEVRIKFNGPKSFTGRARRLKKGEVLLLTNAQEIAYFQSIPALEVLVIEGAVAAEPAVTEDAALLAVAPDGEDDDGPDESEDEDDEEPEDDEDEVLDPEVLQALTKAQLIMLGAKRGVELEMSMNKAEMIGLLTA